MRQRYIVIGSGSIGRRHHENIKILGADSTLLPWRGLDMGILEQNLRDAAGAVIATATDVRIELVKLCASLGTAVYVEKPLAFTSAGLESLLKAAKPVAGRSVAGFMMRYNPAFKALVQDPVDAFRFSMEVGHDVRRWRQGWSFSGSYAARPHGGGVLLDLCHEIDMVTCLYPGLALGEVACIGHTHFPGVDFATRVSLYRAGLVGDVAMDYLSPKSVRRLSVRGRNGGLDLDLVSGREIRWQGARETERHWASERNIMFLDLMRDFMALAEGRDTHRNPLLPRLDLVGESSALVARAWEARRFHGETDWGHA
ncbi:MAG: Gfo/Idh/MocA family oxidoreductase [Boseongicola sp. SB0677_bin_26]|nr:Gfo/Idh/MocA family oxidoreductase [Boseongicola sp. SB0665_bin_10]MYG27814.1 Gfo/Idh/MocA family oxidoreductase [Boseongicola sp. SB0677_bin_26]